VAEATLRVGVIGVGSLGRHHARVYADLSGVRLAGVYDADPERAEQVARERGCLAFAHLKELVAAVDAVSVAVPTIDHHRVARALLEAGKDVLVEKPITVTLEEADDLVRVADARRAVLQVGHVERFNPAAEVLRDGVREPRFIEVHRLASFSPRSLDIDVVLDLMIHDLDILLSLDASEPVQIDAVGVPVLTDKVDVANARVRFASGLIANLTASRISARKTRKFRVWSSRAYISVDFAARAAEVYRLVPRPGGLPEIAVERRGPSDEEPLVRQLAAFRDAVRRRGPAPVPGVDGRRALALAHTILARMSAGAGPGGLAPGQP
jgi:predicted dehydrogenase